MEVLEHYSKGERGDGKVYLNDGGERVKMTKVDEHTVSMKGVSGSSTIPQDPTSSLLMNGDEFHMRNAHQSSRHGIGCRRREEEVGKESEGS